MSHFDDVELLFWAPIGGIGAVICIIALIWSVWADQASANSCKEHGEKYIDSRTGYTLCEQDGGTVVLR